MASLPATHNGHHGNAALCWRDTVRGTFHSMVVDNEPVGRRAIRPRRHDLVFPGRRIRCTETGLRDYKELMPKQKDQVDLRNAVLRIGDLQGEPR